MTRGIQIKGKEKKKNDDPIETMSSLSTIFLYSSSRPVRPIFRVMAWTYYIVYKQTTQQSRYSNDNENKSYLLPFSLENVVKRHSNKK